MVRQLTHDVRNGLNSMELQTAYITDLITHPEEGVDIPAELKRLRAMFAEQGRMLQRFSARFRAGKPETVNYPAKLFVADFRERLAKTQPNFASQVAWTDDLAEEVIAVDAEMIFSALGEFFQNAEHFRENGHPVSAHASAGQKRWQIELGEHHTSLASPTPTWGREPLVSSRRGGCGLGLFYARQLLDLHGGGMEFTHDPAAAHLTTRIYLPLAK
jgi:nitrogen fixation/metabolism regulation signal transduction histidine kinase